MGLIHIYCGEGKGKTTAAVGLSIRAAGNGRLIVFAQFLKTDTSGEIKILKQIPQISVFHAPDHFGFSFQMTEEEKIKAREEYRELLDRAYSKALELVNSQTMEQGNAETKEALVLLVLDEAAAASSCGMISSSKITELLQAKPEGLEIVLTGRNPDAKWLELADYVSEVSKKKHPYDTGICGRKGIEY